MYRSGRNENDSKFFGLVSVSSTKNPVFMRGPAVRKTEYFVVLSVSSFQKLWERFSDRHTESCPSGRRCSTRNAVSRKGPRVRIPNSPPKSPVNKRVCRTFLFCSFAQNRLKTMERTCRFLERTRRFRVFWRIRTVKISSFRHRLRFRSTCCRISPIREVPFR